MQSAFGRARDDTRHARRAFNGADLHELINGQAGRTGSRTFPAIDAGFDVAADLYRTEKRCDSQQRSIGTEIPAPEVLDQQGQQNQQTDDDGRCLPDIAKEIQHLDIGDQAVRCGHEIVDRLGGHRTDQEHKEAKKQVLQPSQRDIQPFWGTQITAEYPLPS